MTKDRGNEPVDVSASLALAARDLVNESKRTLREPARQSTRNNLRPARWYRVIAAIAEPTGDELSTGLAILMRRDGTNRVDTTKTELIYSDAAIDAGEIVLARQTNGVPFVQMQEATATPAPTTCPNGLVRGDCYNVSFGTGVAFPIASGATFEGLIGGVLFPALVAPFEIHANAVLVAIVNSNCNICLSGFPGIESNICMNGLEKGCSYGVQFPTSESEYPIVAGTSFNVTVDPTGAAVVVPVVFGTDLEYPGAAGSGTFTGTSEICDAIVDNKCILRIVQVCGASVVIAEIDCVTCGLTEDDYPVTVGVAERVEFPLNTTFLWSRTGLLRSTAMRAGNQWNSSFTYDHVGGSVLGAPAQEVTINPLMTCVDPSTADNRITVVSPDPINTGNPNVIDYSVGGGVPSSSLGSYQAEPFSLLAYQTGVSENYPRSIHYGDTSEWPALPIINDCISDENTIGQKLPPLAKMSVGTGGENLEFEAILQPNIGYFGTGNPGQTSGNQRPGFEFRGIVEGVDFEVWPGLPTPTDATLEIRSYWNCGPGGDEYFYLMLVLFQSTVVNVQYEVFHANPTISLPINLTASATTGTGPDLDITIETIN